MEKYLFIFTALLGAAYVVSNIFYRLRLPRLIGQIITGILIGSPIGAFLLFSGTRYPEALLSGNPAAIMINMLSSIGIVFLLLLVGLEIDYKKMREVGKDATVIAVSAAIIPFTLGFMVMQALGYSISVSLITGACLSVTAEGTKAMILLELGKLNTKVGEIMLGAGAIDDIFEILFLTLILFTSSNEQNPQGIRQFIPQAIKGMIPPGQVTGTMIEMGILLFNILLFAIVVYLSYLLLPKILRKITKTDETEEFRTLLLFGLVIAIASEALGLGTAIGALIAGMLIQSAIKDISELERMTSNLKILCLGIIVPFFFIEIGLNFAPATITRYPFLFGIITLAAILGKILGTAITKPVTDLSWEQLYLIGWGMNSRGVMELVIATIAMPIFVQESAEEVFSVIVGMAIITTLIFPIILKDKIGKNPEIMD